MYNQSYDEYMRSVLGINNTYDNGGYMQDMYCGDYYEVPRTNIMNNTIVIEKCYPDIYKMVHPMVCKVCQNAPINITEEVIEKMTNEIYINIEGQNDNNEINIAQNRSNDKNVKDNLKNEIKETRQQNYLLKDLIKILLIRELLGNRIPQRPGRPPMPPKPPFDRPPMPRSIYEQRLYYGGEIY